MQFVDPAVQFAATGLGSWKHFAVEYQKV